MVYYPNLRNLFMFPVILSKSWSIVWLILIMSYLEKWQVWDDVRRVRRRIKESGLQKEAGRSCIEVGEQVYSFVDGDTSPPMSGD
ncbi:hypothetical protein GBA52_015823 [Prunus armeniaca]|nr:hypothetical protein GBA52_015823 [Prunus armeniaca]